MSALNFSIPEPQSFDHLLSLKGQCAVVTGGSRGLGEAIVGRSRYAEKSHLLAAGRNLHEHFLSDEGVILQPFVRKRQHDHIIHCAL